MYYYSLKPNFRDDFNYPSLSRKDLMNLDTIKERDFPRKKINQINSNRKWSQNLYNLDIDRSYPKRTDIYLNKVDFINKIDDIEKARPNKERILNKPNYILNVRDIEKAYPKKDKLFTGLYNANKENKNILYKKYNNRIYNDIKKENYKQQNLNDYGNNRYEHIENNNNILINNSKYNNINYKNNESNENIKKDISNVYDRNNNFFQKRYFSNSAKNIMTKPLDTNNIIKNQKGYKDTIHDVFNNFPKFINDSKPDNFLLNHNHDLVLGTPNKNNRLDIMMDKSNKLLSYDFSSKIKINENKKNKFDFMNTPDSVKINRSIPIEFKNQGLERLYKELDNYKPTTYEQHLDLFTQNY